MPKTLFAEYKNGARRCLCSDGTHRVVYPRKSAMKLIDGVLQVPISEKRYIGSINITVNGKSTRITGIAEKHDGGWFFVAAKGGVNEYALPIWENNEPNELELARLQDIRNRLERNTLSISQSELDSLTED